jgi:MFS-type transporter involved in bile tolerance (Atg22 family)
VGPAIYGIVSDLANDRVAALVISVFFIAGLVLLQGVEEPVRTKLAH